MTVKKCKACEFEKPVSEFYPHKKTRDRLDTMCKPCKKAAATQWARKNPDKNRKKTKAYNERHPDRRKETSRKYYETNKDIIKGRIKKWVDENPDKIREYGRIHANRRRARKLENGTEDYTEQMVIEAYGTDCHICNQSINLEAPRRVGSEGWELGLHLDHVVPLSKGGDDRIENLRPAHGMCNLKKTDTI